MYWSEWEEHSRQKEVAEDQAECCRGRENKGGARRCPVGRAIEFSVILGAVGTHDKGSGVG